MLHTCAAFGCTNNNMKAICKEKKISFHRFPLKKPECKEWLIKLKRENFVPTEYSHLCSEHFTEDCFIYQPFTNRRGLKPGAIPTLFSYVKTSKQKRTSYEFEKSVPQPSTSNASNVSSDLTNDKGIQTDDNSFSILYENNKKLEEENVLLKEQLQKRNLTPDNVESDYIMNILTGFDKQRFGVICDFLCLKNNDDITNGRQKLFMFLVHLKVGLTEDEMAVIFALSQSTISRYLKEITEAIYLKIKNVNIWPSKENIKLTMPYDFQKNFPECRVILDCTEFEIQKPSDPTEQQLTFSFYKNTNTVKCLIGITPSGAISFISDTFTGCISDKELFLKSGILTILQKGDLIIADRGFLVKKELEKAGINIKTPHFLKDKIQFDFEERKENKKISHHQIHVERAIGRIKRFKLLNGPIPYTLLPSINEIVYIAGFLVNFGTRLI